MEQEMIVMVRLSDKAWIPVHVLAYDGTSAVTEALTGLAAAGIGYRYPSMTSITSFPQNPINVHFRNLRSALLYEA